MKYLTDFYRSVITYLHKSFADKGYRRWRITISEYEEFPDFVTRDEFVRNQLERNNFDLEAEIMQYRGVNNPYILFEQRG